MWPTATTAASVWSRSSALIAALVTAGCSSTVVVDEDWRTPDVRPPLTCARGTICTIAGTDHLGLEGDGGPAVTALLYWPIDMSVGPDGDLYVIDWNNHRIRKIDETTGIISTFAGIDDLGDGPVGVPATESHFNHPTNILFEGDRFLHMAAWHNSKVKSIDLATGILTDTCGNGKRAYTGDGGPAHEAAFDLPTALALRDDGVLMIMDQGNMRIRAVDPIGTITTYAGATCMVNKCQPNETPEPCPNSDKFVCNAAMNQKLCAQMPGCLPGFSSDGEPASSLKMSQPYSASADPGGRLAFDRDGNLNFADMLNHRVRRIDRATTIVSTVIGDGDVALDHPSDIAFGPDGALYVADTFHHCIRAKKNGVVRTVAGRCGQKGFAGDGGPPTEALLERPYGIEVGAHGELYIADTYNGRIRVVTP
jgi:hypothetical protein